MNIDISKIVVRGNPRTKFEHIDALASSMAEIGQLQPIMVAEDGAGFVLVGGERRLRAAKVLGWSAMWATVVTLDGLRSELAALDSNLQADSLKGHDLDEALANRKRIYEALHPETKHGGERGQVAENATCSAPRFTKDTAEKLGVSERAVQQAVQRAENLTPKAKEAYRSEALNKTEATAAASMPAPVQDKLVEAVTQAKTPAEARKAARELLNEEKKARAEERRKERAEKIAEMADAAPALDGAIGRFPVLLADPPWRYEHAISTSREIENQYPTMSLDEIKALGVADITTDDAVLFLWATSPKLAESMEVVEAWGFTYRTSLVWVKDRIGMGYYARSRHELMLIATKGSIPAPGLDGRLDSVIEAPRTKHSRKPVEFYERIEAMYPELQKLEMFAREAREGWSVWGNQAPREVDNG